MITVCSDLSKRATIPQIKEKLEFINTISSDEFWKSSDIVNLEKVRVELRSLMIRLIRYKRMPLKQWDNLYGRQGLGQSDLEPSTPSAEPEFKALKNKESKHQE